MSTVDGGAAAASVVVLGVVGAAGATGAAGGVVAVACVVLDGNVIGVPMVSETTGAFANGSCGPLMTDRVLGGAISVWESETTGRRRRTVLGTIDVCASGCRPFTPRACACVCASGGSAACGFTFGTRRSGIATFGSAMFGSGTTGAAITGCLNTAATGPAYMPTSTSRQRPAHQYLTPRERIAVSPNGFAAATRAYPSVAFTPLSTPTPDPHPTPSALTDCNETITPGSARQ